MTSDREALKRQAAERALEHVRDGMVLGLGTGSTMRHLLELLAERRRAGALGRITGVPTSRETAERARALGIPLATLEQEPRLDLALDGADEIDPRLDLIKGLGGALLWEKIVACAADRLVIIADESKLVNRLGERAPVPVEVVPFGWTTHLARLDRLGAKNAALELGKARVPWVTLGTTRLIVGSVENFSKDSIRDQVLADVASGRALGHQAFDLALAAIAHGEHEHTPRDRELLGGALGAFRWQ